MLVFLFLGFGKIKRLVNHPKRQRVALLTNAFLFSVVFFAVDILTDIITAANFFNISKECTQRRDANESTENFIRLCGRHEKDSWLDWLPGSDFEVYRWGILTVLPIFLPLLARIFFNAVTFARSFKLKDGVGIIPGRRSIWIEDLKQLPWHFPILQPLR
jgi:hypothetical protein